jgi:hypothetical protein
MPQPAKDGKTLWEMFTARFHASNGDAIAFSNPLDLRIGSPVIVSPANGPEFADYDFSVKEIRQYLRAIDGQEFIFTDYALRAVNRKTFDANDERIMRLRVVPNSAGAHDSLLLKLYDEFAFAEDFLAVVKDTTGIFETTDDATGAKETFSRLNDLRESYNAAVLVVNGTNEKGQAPQGQTGRAKIEYWDYWRDVDIGSGNTAKEFVFVELNSDTGWFQIWRGREFFS